MSHQTALHGACAAVSAYIMWGLAPLYFKLLAHMNSLEIFMHRILWSAVLLAVLIIMTQKWQVTRKTLTNKRQVSYLLLSAGLLSINWWLFIYAIDTDRVLEASLGYYINPLFNALLGYLILKERMTTNQRVAITIASLAVLIQVIALGYIPWIPLLLAISFSFYGLIKKRLSIDSITSLTVETSIILPFALFYAWFYAQPHSHPANLSVNNLLIVMSAGLITIAPLLLFNVAAKKLTLTSLGLAQFVAPSLMFLLAAFVFHEPVTQIKMITFALIWSALAIYVWDSLKEVTRQ